MKNSFVKRIISLLFSAIVVISSVEAIEITVGGKVQGSFDYINYKSNPPIAYMGIGCGPSAYCEIDFTSFGICKLGIRPELSLSFPLETTDNNPEHFSLFDVKLPIWFTISPSYKFDLAIGVGWGLAACGPTFDIQTAFKLGPGKIVVNPYFSFDVVHNAEPTEFWGGLGVGYQYTF